MRAPAILIHIGTNTTTVYLLHLLWKLGLQYPYTCNTSKFAKNMNDKMIGQSNK